MCRPSTRGFSDKPCLSLCIFVFDPLSVTAAHTNPLDQDGALSCSVFCTLTPTKCLLFLCGFYLYFFFLHFLAVSPALNPEGRLVDGAPTEPETSPDTASISDETCVRTSCSHLPPISCWPCNSWPAPTEVKMIFSHSCSVMHRTKKYEPVELTANTSIVNFFHAARV